MVLLARFVLLLVIGQSAALPEWSRLASDYFNMNVLCAQCGEVCEKFPAANAKDPEAVEGQHWACYVGCRTTCLLQVGAGPRKYNYEESRKLCEQGCHHEFKAIEDIPTIYSLACLSACASKVIPPPLIAAELEKAYAVQDALDDQDREPDEILLDPGLREQFFRNGASLPHSQFKTLPRHKSLDLYFPYKHGSNGAAFNEGFEYLLRRHSSNVLLAAGLMGMLLSILSLVLLFRLVFNRTQRKIYDNTCEDSEHFTVVSVCTETEVKAVPSNLEDGEFVPPAPPPKYSDIVATA